MNKGFIIGLITGLGIGGAVGYFVTDRLVDKKYQDLANEDIEKMKDYYTEKLRKIESSETEEPKEENVQEEPKVIVKQEAAAKMSYNKPPLADLVRDYVAKDEVEESDEAEQAYFITEEDFGEMGYDQVVLEYDGHCLRENDGEELIDIEAPNFEEILETIDNYISDDGVVYARCDDTKCDYEITINDSPMEE